MSTVALPHAGVLIRLVKPLLDILPAHVRSRVHVLGPDYQAFLAADLDAEALEMIHGADAATLAHHRALKRSRPR